jgi:cathepsin L
MHNIYTFCFFLFSTTQPICYETNDSAAEHDIHDFNKWRLKYNKTYDGKFDISEHFNNWRDNRDFVEYYNQNKEFTMEVNSFADIHNGNWKTRNGQNNKMANTNRVFHYYEEDEDMTLPAAVDWRDKDAVTPIKNQGQCGSCWAFSAVGSMEGQHALKTKHLVNLSESQIVDCDINGTDEGCDGGWMDGAFEYVIKNHGIDTEESYPYQPQDNPCKFNKSNVAATFSGYKDVVGGENALKKAVAKIGPIAVAIDAGESSFQFYKNGVYYDPNCSPEMLDHGVLVVGYGTTMNGTDYWIVKNSWGENWGDKGYIYMARNRNNSCGIASKPSYPIV